MASAPRASAALALLGLAALAAAADGFDYVRVFEPPVKTPGVWGGRFAARPGEGALVGLAVVADWWDGPGDARVGDPKGSAMTGILLEFRRGDGAWIALPPAERDLRLTTRVALPAGSKDLPAGSPDGEWGLRQKAGGAYPARVRLEFTCRGDPLQCKDLAVQELSLPKLDPPPVVGRPHFPDRTENRTLHAGDPVDAVVVVANLGARRTREVDLDLLVVPLGKRQGLRMAFVQVPPLEPGATVRLEVSGKIPEDVSETPAVFEILAIVNPRNAEREVELFNNALTRAFKFELPVKKDATPTDLRDR